MTERYIGDGVYASLDPAQMIILRTMRGEQSMGLGGGGCHWIALEPEVLDALIRYACEIGWGELCLRAVAKYAAEKHEADDADA